MNNYKNIIKIKIIDDYDYTIYKEFYVEKMADIEEKLKELIRLCKDYDTYQRIDNFIFDNFKTINIEEKTFKI